ncbi:MAG: 1-deoxy-D-xylulose-5-phosphate reductoisomerase [Pseudomonadales bacterium]|jgi:1-deoxy-D-xylulose-5-phosphate reductoisomerase|nr:1-deoxy-D-xylulose-5-phosphate reductoisomerase [Pseudomonadales bacterium]
MQKQTLTILGATGSIGISTLRVLAEHPGRYRVHALTAQRNDALLLQQCRAFTPRYAVLSEAQAAARLRAALAAEGLATEVLEGVDALLDVASAPEVDSVMAAIVGGAGLLPTLAAARAGKKVLLANKEALVMAGELFMHAARASGAVVLPIDSEHNAIFQCLPIDAQGRFAQQKGCGFSKLILTASGGPFREQAHAALAEVTPEQACAHPNWVMGRKISVDSATLVNKGLELIEACHLFAVPPAKVEVLIHPQSIVHSLVCYDDGSMLAQLGNPDMRTPIAYALAWPERMTSGVAPLDLTQAANLQFQPPDLVRFPGLRLGREAMQAGGAAPLIYNAANEIAVAAFLAGQVGFLRIPAIIATVLEQAALPAPRSLEDVLRCDAEARALAQRCLP